MQSKPTPASGIALGGVLAALAVVIMSMGTLIPVATYVCPMLSALILQLVLKTCGRRIAWGWYAVVSILSLLMAPDKEAAAVFAENGITVTFSTEYRSNTLVRGLPQTLFGLGRYTITDSVTGDELIRLLEN